MAGGGPSKKELLNCQSDQDIVVEQEEPSRASNFKEHKEKDASPPKQELAVEDAVVKEFVRPQGVEKAPVIEVPEE